MSFFKPFQVQAAFHWMLGQVGTEKDQGWPLLAIFFLLAFLWSFWRARDLDRLLLGEEIATSLATPLRKIRLQTIIVVAVLCALSVALSGLIGFVGLLAPHLSLILIRTHRHRNLLLHSALWGAILLLGADVLGRIISPAQEIPAGGLTAILGAPIFIFLLKRGAANARTS